MSLIEEHIKLLRKNRLVKRCIMELFTYLLHSIDTISHFIEEYKQKGKTYINRI